MSNAYIWIKIPTSIPANSSITIYMFVRNSIQYPYTGIAPYLTSTYGQYDNGNNVFNIYQNFAGTSLPSGWTVVSGTSGTDYVVNNGLQLKTTNAFIEGPNVTQNFILEGYFQFISDAYNGWDFGVYSSSSSAYGMHPDGGGTNTWASTWYYNNGYTQISGSGHPVGTGYYYIWQIINNAGSITINFDNPSYTTLYNASFTNSLSNAPIALGKRFDGNSADQSLNVIFYWIRVRAYPPNGVMPSFSIQLVPLTPTISVNTSTNFQFNVSIFDLYPEYVNYTVYLNGSVLTTNNVSITAGQTLTIPYTYQYLFNQSGTYNLTVVAYGQTSGITSIAADISVSYTHLTLPTIYSV